MALDNLHNIFGIYLYKQRYKSLVPLVDLIKLRCLVHQILFMLNLLDLIVEVEHEIGGEDELGRFIVETGDLVSPQV